MARPSEHKLKLLQKMLAAKGIEKRATATIPVRDRSVDTPLSYGQQRMWFVQQLEPDSAEAHIQGATLMLWMGRSTDAEELGRKALEMAPENAEAVRFVADIAAARALGPKPDERSRDEAQRREAELGQPENSQFLRQFVQQSHQRYLNLTEEVCFSFTRRFKVHWSDFRSTSCRALHFPSVSLC